MALIFSRSEYIYQTRIYDASGNMIGLYDDLVSLNYRKIVNGIGMAILTVPDTHPLIAQLVDDLLLQVNLIYLSPSNGIIYKQDFVGLYRDKQIATDDDDLSHYLLYFVGTNDVLSRNIVAYPSGVNNKSQWTGQNIHVIAKQIVQNNCTSALATTANGRLRNANPVRSLIANLGSGHDPTTPTINYSCAYRNVLEVVQELAQLGGFDFEVYFDKSSSNSLVYLQYDLMGTDKHTTIIFDLSLDNIASANVDGERLREKTVAIVGGDGTGSGRTTSIHTGANQSASDDYELFIDARASASTELDSIGDAKLDELAARTSVNVNISPSSGYLYNRDYDLGDLVTASYQGIQETKKITTVEVTFDQEQNSKIRIELSNP